MMEKERRQSELRCASALTRQLNDAQKLTLVDVERFGWELKFIRRPMFLQPLPVVFDPERKHFAVLKEDGTLDESPAFDIRK